MRYALYYIVANEQIGLNAIVSFARGYATRRNERFKNSKDFGQRIRCGARQIAGNREVPWP